MEEKKKSWAQNHIENLIALFRKELSEDKDEQILVLKGHLLCEYYLNDLIIVYFENGFEKLNDKQYGFFKKMIDLKQLNVLSEDDFEILKGLNNVRNDMSHSLHYEINQKDIDKLGMLLHRYGAGYDYLVEKYKDNDKKKVLINILENIILIPSLLCFNYKNKKEGKSQN